MGNDPSDEVIHKFEEARRKINELEDEKGKKAMLYSGAKLRTVKSPPNTFSVCVPAGMPRNKYMYCLMRTTRSSQEMIAS